MKQNHLVLGMGLLTLLKPELIQFIITLTFYFTLPVVHKLNGVKNLIIHLSC